MPESRLPPSLNWREFRWISRRSEAIGEPLRIPERADDGGPDGKDPDDAGLVFAAHNNHDPRCGRPPRVLNTDRPGLYYGYFENRYGEQYVFTFDRATGTGTVAGGDLGWDEPRSFTVGLLDEALRNTRRLAAEVAGLGRTEAPDLPTIDAALALGCLAGLTGEDEVIWLRACLSACAPIAGPSEGRRSGWC
jgi:hypothetical protein